LATKARFSPINGADIGDGAKRHMMQHAQQIRLWPFAGKESAARAILRLTATSRDQHQPHRREMTEGRRDRRARFGFTSASTSGNSSPLW